MIISEKKNLIRQVEKIYTKGKKIIIITTKYHLVRIFRTLLIKFDGMEDKYAWDAYVIIIIIKRANCFVYFF